MADILYTFIGVDTAQLEASTNTLRSSSVYRQIEGDSGLSNVVVVMGPNITNFDKQGIHRVLAESGRAPNDPTKLYIFLDTTTVAMRDTPSGPLALTVDQLIAHEMAHATFPTRAFTWQDAFNGLR